MAYYKKTKQYKKNKSKNFNSVDQVLVQSQAYLDKKISDLPKENEAKGVAVHTVVNRRTSSSFLSDVKDYSDTRLEDRENVVTLARKLRQVEGICGTVADLLADFAITRGEFVSDNEELQMMLNRWAKYINTPNVGINKKTVIQPVSGLSSVLRKIFDDYITDGDAVFTLFWEKNVKMDPTIDTQGLFIPTSIRVLDTLMLEIDEQLAKLGIEQIKLNLSDELKKKITNPQTDAEKQLAKSVPKTWIQAINAREDIYLDPNVTFHLKRNAKDYRPWGDSLFVRAFNAIAAKRRLQAVDEATIDGLINRLTVFSLGLEDETKNKLYHKPSPARVQALIDLLTQPKRINAIVWPGPDLKIEDIGPDGKILEFVEKYNQADKDILRALHVSPLLIDGGSSGQSVRDWAAFLATEVGLDAIRENIERLLTSIAQEIALVNKLKYTTLYYTFDNQLLKDEAKLRDLAIKVFELGGMSIKTFVTIMGYNFDTEKRLKEKEDSEGLHEIFVNRSIPYQGNILKPDAGRPDGTTNRELNKDSSPKTDTNSDATASVVEVAGVSEYYKLFLTSFNKIKRDLINLQPAADRKNSSRDLEISLIAGFSEFKKLVELELKEYFTKTVGNTTLYNKEFSRLIDWNNKYIDNFYQQLREDLIASYEDYDRFTSKLDGFSYRIYQYANECLLKATWFGKMLKAKREGKTKCLWIAHENTKCMTAQTADGGEFDIEYMLDNFPPHPECKCKLEFI